MVGFWPPLIKNDRGFGVPNSSVPTTRWDVEGAFDSAAECEAIRIGHNNECQAGLAKQTHADMEKEVEDLKASKQRDGVNYIPYGVMCVSGYMNERCVPAEHIYPPARPAK